MFKKVTTPKNRVQKEQKVALAIKGRNTRENNKIHDSTHKVRIDRHGDLK